MSSYSRNKGKVGTLLGFESFGSGGRTLEFRHSPIQSVFKVCRRSLYEGGVHLEMIKVI